MPRGSRIFLAGLISATVLFGGAGIRDFVAERQINKLIAKQNSLEGHCKEEHFDKEGLELFFACTPPFIKNHVQLPDDDQANLMQVWTEIESYGPEWTATWAFDVAGLLLICSVVPLVWYFLLRRLREVGDTLRGAD